MKVRAFIVTLFLSAFAFAPSRLVAIPPPPPDYIPTLISPTAGQVLHPGERVRVEWRTSIRAKWPSYCELELWLSLDGGSSYTLQVTPSIDPNSTFFYWTVPNTPTNAAVLEIRFGCEPGYPETYNPQIASPFVIATGVGQ